MKDNIIIVVLLALIALNIQGCGVDKNLTATGTKIAEETVVTTGEVTYIGIINNKPLYMYENELDRCYVQYGALSCVKK